MEAVMSKRPLHRTNSDPLFAVPFKTEHGDTLHSDNPDGRALAQAQFIRNKLHLKCKVVLNSDGSWTVKGQKLAPITYMQTPTEESDER